MNIPKMKGFTHTYNIGRNEEFNTTRYNIPYEITALINKVMSHAHAMLSMVRKQTAAIIKPITVQHVLLNPP